MGGETAGATAVLDRLIAAIGAYDLDALVGCFGAGYVNETPAHPQRGFQGRAQVRANWTQIFEGVPDVRAEVVQRAAVADQLWTEWRLSGTRSDGPPFELVGVVLFRVVEQQIVSARFYLEPVERGSDDVDMHTHRVVSGEVGP